jgi:hypothetical protein
LRHEELRAGFRKSSENELHVAVAVETPVFKGCWVRPTPNSIPPSHAVRVPKQSLIWTGTGFRRQIGTLLP